MGFLERASRAKATKFFIAASVFLTTGCSTISTQGEESELINRLKRHAVLIHPAGYPISTDGKRLDLTKFG